VTPLWLKSSQWLLALIYVVLAMPYVYRSLDAGLGAIDLKTLVEAAARRLWLGLDNLARSSSPICAALYSQRRTDPCFGFRRVHNRQFGWVDHDSGVDLSHPTTKSTHQHASWR